MALPMVSKNRMHPDPSLRLCHHRYRAAAKDRLAIKAIDPRWCTST